MAKLVLLELCPRQRRRGTACWRINAAIGLPLSRRRCWWLTAMVRSLPSGVGVQQGALGQPAPRLAIKHCQCPLWVKS
jgi:hypothetical protein